MASESLDFSDCILNRIASIIMDATTYTTHSTRWFVSFPMPVQGNVSPGVRFEGAIENIAFGSNWLIHRGACLDRESRTLRPVSDRAVLLTDPTTPK